jgi:NAD(P)-dependent dehydrogenase (short-subunit alcohol dehydrogenase family)
MKNVLVTGATKGIGREIALTLAQDYNVFIVGRNKNELQRLVEESKIKDFIGIDLTSENACLEVIKKFSDIDILINNAGEYIYKEIDKYTTEDIEKLFKINAQIPFLLTSLYSPNMKAKKWGRIVNIGSISAMIGEAGASLYSATKASLCGLSKAVGLELAEYGITVNTIHPGWVDTNLAQESITQSDFSVNEIIETIPQRRFISPNEIANLVKYVISDNAKGLTGQNINLCAGLTIG